MHAYRNSLEKPGLIHLHKWRRPSPKWPCNICGKRFKRHSRFERFCEDCKQDNELYRFAGWLRA